jgi:putative DNA primase/helicase
VTPPDITPPDVHGEGDQAAGKAAPAPDPSRREDDALAGQAATGDDDQDAAEPPPADTKKRSGSGRRATPTPSVEDIDYEAEDNTMADAMQSPPALAAIAEMVAAGELAAGDFHQIKWSRLLPVMLALRAEGVTAIDPVVVRKAVEKDAVLLSELGGSAAVKELTHYLNALIVEAVNVRTHAETVHEMACRRQYRRVTEEMTKANGKPAAEMVADAVAALTAVPAQVTPHADLCRSFADIEAKPVKWIWERWIPAGMVSILFGLSGLGKSHIYVDIAGNISHGTNFPDGSKAPQGNVVIMSAEDAADSVLKPRLVFAGADVSRIFHFPSVEKFDGKGKRVFSLVEDCEILKEHIIRHKAILAVIDPITAYLSGVESHVVTEVRGALAMVDEVAQSTGVAILAVMHPNKAGGGDMKALQRLSGSGAFGDAPRAVALVAEDAERKDEKRCLLLSAKLNLGLKPDGIGFHIIADGPLTCSSGIAWDNDPVTVTADQAMAPMHRASPNKQAAMDFLTAALADGEWHSARDLIDEAGERGINERTLRRAATKEMKVAQRKVGFPAVSEWCSEADF